MKKKLIDLWKNVVKVVFDAFNFYDTILSIIVVLIVATISVVVISVVSNFISGHQWVILIFDATCIVLLTMAIRYRLDRSFQKPKGKLIFWLLFSNVLILIIQSFGALWNFLIMLFVLWPVAIGLTRFSFKRAIWLSLFKTKSRQIKNDPVIISMWEHSSWGDSIYWIDWEKRKLSGHMPHLPKKGDILRAKMESGKIGLFEFSEVRAMNSPPDHFFANVTDLEYET